MIRKKMDFESIGKTNLEEVKRVAIDFLYMDVKPNEIINLFVEHPIFESVSYPYIDKSNLNTDNDVTLDNLFKPDVKLVNILEDDEALRDIRLQLEEEIYNKTKLSEIIFMIRKSYRLTFLKFIKEYLSKEDFDKYFIEVWVTSEDPNNDVNVPIELSTKWFRECNKKDIMTKEELKIYNSLQEKVELYRGVSIGRNPKGLSWTNNKEKAIWFAHRFDNNYEKGYVLKAYVDKKNILAVLNYGEDEIVVDTESLDLDSITKLLL